MPRWDEGLVDHWQPRLGQGFDPLELDLSVDEAYLLSQIDGQANVAELCDRCGMPRGEVAVMLQRMIQLGVVDGTDAPTDLGESFDLKESLALEGLFDEPEPTAADGEPAADLLSLDDEPLDDEPDSWEDDTRSDNLLPALDTLAGELERDALDLDAGFDGPPDPTDVASRDDLLRLLDSAPGPLGDAPPGGRPGAALDAARAAADPALEWQADAATPGATDLSDLAIDDSELAALGLDEAAPGDEVAAEWQDEGTPPGVELELPVAPETPVPARRRPAGRRDAPQSLVPQPDADDDDDEDGDERAAARQPSPGAWYGNKRLPGDDGPEVDPVIVALPGRDPARSGEDAVEDIVDAFDDEGPLEDAGDAPEVAFAEDDEDLLALDSDAFEAAPARDRPSDDWEDATDQLARSRHVGAPSEEVTVLLLDGAAAADEDEEEVVLLDDARESGSDGDVDDEEEVVLVVPTSSPGSAGDEEEEVELALPAAAGLRGASSEALTQALGLDRVRAAEAPLELDPPVEVDAEDAFVVIQEPERRSARDTVDEVVDDDGLSQMQVVRDISVLPVGRGVSLDPDMAALDPVVGPLDPDVGPLDPEVGPLDPDEGPLDPVVGMLDPEVEPFAPAGPGKARQAEADIEELPASALLPIEDDDPPFPSLEVATQALGTEGLVLFDDLSTMHLAERFNLVRTAEGGMLRALCLDPNPRVICELITQPTFEIEHACLVARWQSSSETLRELHLQGTFIQDPRVQAALLDNPRAPVDMIVPLMDSMKPQQLFQLCLREDLPHDTRVAAAYRLREGYEALSPQERVDMILASEGANLLLAGLSVDEDVTDLLCTMKFESTALASNLARYPGTPLRVLQRLYQQPVVQDNLEIKALVRQNPNWPT